MDQREQIAAAAGRVALRAAEELDGLAAAQGRADVKTARELSALLREMLSLRRELGAGQERELTVRFVDGTEDGTV